MSNMLDWALAYARFGLAVHPLRRDKKPILDEWQKKASKDPEVIKDWWRKYPGAMIGIATGAMSGGVCVIDMDNDELAGKDGYGAIKAWQKEHDFFPESWQSITPRGGYHYYFRADEEVRNRIAILPDVDVRGDGGYVVAPPSVNAEGKNYEWEQAPDEYPLADINETIRFFLQTGRNNKQTQFSLPETIGDGTRNGTLFKYACMMQAKGASDEAIMAATLAENQVRCNPPLDENEVQKIVASALKYEKGRPLFVSSSGEVFQGQREPEFDTDEKGRLKDTFNNFCEAISYDVELCGKIRFNTLANAIYVYGKLPWDETGSCRAWTNSDDLNLLRYLERMYGLKNKEKTIDAVNIVANDFEFNPVVEELEQIHRDFGSCAGAIRKLLPEYMGCVDSEYNFQCMRVYMLGAISRAYHPGCKFDYSIILHGAQGFGKSEFLRHLAINSDWFNDNFNTFDGDKAIEKLLGMWIVEMAELKALKSSKDAESFKSFLTSRVDTYRAPYERRTEQRPRMCVFAGTTNNRNVFVDKTGNRRFLPIETRKGCQTKDLFGDQQAVMDDFKRAWAEAMEIFLQADKQPVLVLPREVQEMAERMQEKFTEDDDRVGIIQNWLNNTASDKVCVPMIIEDALNMDVQKVSKQHKREIQEIMDTSINGWTRIRSKDGRSRARFSRYGLQVAFMRELDV